MKGKLRWLRESFYYFKIQTKIQKLCRSHHFWDASLMVWCISTWCINIMDALINALCSHHFCVPAHWKAPELCLLVPPIWSRSGREFGSTDSQSEKSFSPNTSGRFMDGSRNQRWVSQNSCGDLQPPQWELCFGSCWDFLSCAALPSLTILSP